MTTTAPPQTADHRIGEPSDEPPQLARAAAAGRTKGRRRGRLWVLAAATVVSALAASAPASAEPRCDGPTPPPACSDEPGDGGDDSAGAPPEVVPPASPQWPESYCREVHGVPASAAPPASPTRNIDLLVGNAPLAIEQDAPFGAALHLPPRIIAYVRCIAQFVPARVFIQAGNQDQILMTIDREDVFQPWGQAAIRFGTRTDSGKWLVTHRRDEGEVTSEWRNGHTGPTPALDIRQPGSGDTDGVTVDTVGFVKPGLLGIATGRASFTYATFWQLVSGYRVTFEWICDWCSL